LSRKKRDSCWKFFKILAYYGWEAEGVVRLIIQGKEKGGNRLADAGPLDILGGLLGGRRSI
jgi:hypothetical protein